MFKDIEYERNGIKKMASERFKDALIAEGWNVVIEENSEEKPQKKRGRPAKKDD